MADLSTLRSLIILSFVVSLLFMTSSFYYDPLLASPLITESNRLIDEALVKSMALNVVFLLTMLTLAYGSAALWFGYASGKWTFILFILLDLSISFFTPVVALSWLGNILLSMYMLVIGMILAVICLSPMKEELSRPKPFRFWEVAGMFILFLIIIFAPIFFMASHTAVPVSTS